MTTHAPRWLHVHFWFDRERILRREQAEAFRQYLAELVRHWQPAIQRYFYLFEREPHCFLAVESIHPELQARLARWLDEERARPGFIRRVELAPAHDADNPEVVLDVLSTVCRYHLRSDLDPSSRATDRSLLQHLIHCILNMVLTSTEVERRFYQRQLRRYATPTAIERRHRAG